MIKTNHILTMEIQWFYCLKNSSANEKEKKIERIVESEL